MRTRKQVRRVHVAKDFHDWLKLESVKHGKSMIEYSQDLSEELGMEPKKERRRKFETSFF